MDTTSHIVIGLGLGALSQIDPVIGGSATLSQAILLGTVVGSNAPDFDFIYKLKGNGSYNKNHRGWSHSCLLLPLWGLAVSSSIYFFFSDISFLHLFLWTFIAVILHVFLDLFNVYGTQVLKPFSQKKVAFDAIPLTDPYILILHFAGFCMIPFIEAGRVFFMIYLLMFLYICGRVIYAAMLKRFLQKHFRNALQIKLVPKAAMLKWGILIETNEDFLYGVYSRRNLIIEHTLPKRMEKEHVIIESTTDSLLSDYLISNDYAFPIVKPSKNGYFVYWKDLRFWRNSFLPQLAIMYISSDFKSRASFIGWIYSHKQYKKVLRGLEGKAENSFVVNHQAQVFKK